MAGYSAAHSARNAPWLCHNSADSHLSREMNVRTVTGYGYAPPELAGEGGREGGAAIPCLGYKIIRFRSDLKSLIQEEKKKKNPHCIEAFGAVTSVRDLV